MTLSLIPFVHGSMRQKGLFAELGFLARREHTSFGAPANKRLVRTRVSNAPSGQLVSRAVQWNRYRGSKGQAFHSYIQGGMLQSQVGWVERTIQRLTITVRAAHPTKRRKRGQAHFISIQSALDHPGPRPLSSPPSACHGVWPRVDAQSLARSYPQEPGVTQRLALTQCRVTGTHGHGVRSWNIIF
jgi:hypothetical protein